MASVAACVAELRTRGFSLAIDGEGKLSVEPAARISPKEDQWLRAYSKQVKAILRAEAVPKPRLPPPNTTPTPDVIFDHWLAILTGSEVKVLLYLIRRTYGFKKESDRVSIMQFCEGIVTAEGKRLDHGTGLARRHVIAALASLQRHGIVRRVDGGQGRSRIGVYALVLEGGPDGAVDSSL